MKATEEFFRTIYQKFNSRDIEAVISNMTADVQWANGMEGGYEHGHRGVRNYWIRQFGLVRSQVTPLEIKKVDDAVVIKVRQEVHNLKGIKLSNTTVKHIFHMKDGMIARFDIAKS
jgi:hypothetical protein